MALGDERVFQYPKQSLAVPSHNPLPLSATQEAQVRDIYHTRVRQKCAQEIKAFASCAFGRTLTVAFACRSEHRRMNACMKQHATREEHDAAREEWFTLRAERQQQRDQRAKVAVAQEGFLREWWGLPEEARLARRANLELHDVKNPTRIVTARDGASSKNISSEK